jgi:phosphoribosylaminoimidazolecarboxamide formyltransferase / IMP cyclohydrolase
VELVFAPGYDDDALEVLQRKPAMRVLEDSEGRGEPVTEPDIRRVRGGILVQDRDLDVETRDDMSVVTARRPSEEEWGDLLFAWKVCKHVRSNAIVLAHDLTTAGIGAGQMSRVDSVRVAIEKARAREGSGPPPLHGAVMASDAFFPFADGPQAAIDAGVRAVIQPGGSKRDHEVVEACDAADVAMVFTARRHFRH